MTRVLRSNCVDKMSLDGEDFIFLQMCSLSRASCDLDNPTSWQRDDSFRKRLYILT